MFLGLPYCVVFISMFAPIVFIFDVCRSCNFEVLSRSSMGTLRILNEILTNTNMGLKTFYHFYSYFLIFLLLFFYSII